VKKNQPNNRLVFVYGGGPAPNAKINELGSFLRPMAAAKKCKNPNMTDSLSEVDGRPHQELWTPVQIRIPHLNRRPQISNGSPIDRLFYTQVATRIALHTPGHRKGFGNLIPTSTGMTAPMVLTHARTLAMKPFRIPARWGTFLLLPIQLNHVCLGVAT
jgi:hypothetical protein